MKKIQNQNKVYSTMDKIYNAYTFVSDLVKSAKNSIILIDNYIDDTVLTLLDKREIGVSALIYTQQISRQFQLDIKNQTSAIFKDSRKQSSKYL